MGAGAGAESPHFNHCLFLDMPTLEACWKLVQCVTPVERKVERANIFTAYSSKFTGVLVCVSEWCRGRGGIEGLV